MVELQKLLETVIEKKASDLHVTTGAPPQFRIDGKLLNFDPTVLTAADTKRLCYSILTDAQRHKFEEDNELDFSFGIKGLSRFRGNIYMQRGAVAGAFGAISFDILSFSELGVPPIAGELIKKPKGLVLVTGPTGTGKSTTLAAMIDKINFVGKTLRDGSPVPKDGNWLEVKGPLKMCEHGLHWSRQPFDALQYAPGPILCLVDASGEIIEERNKGCSTRRRIVAKFGATKLLGYFARMQALSVIHLWNPTEVVLDYLMTGDSTIKDAAKDAAMAAERAAAWAAARDDFNALVYECFEGMA